MQTQTFPLKNMDCDACQRLVSMTLQDLPGVEKVVANEREVAVTYDEGKITPATLQSALADVGHAA
ncbi:MAG: heavy-metal-associated domain-containing protein [bacterium]|nr:heavy-metal-associated domain-containing protein [bacterium]